MKKRENVFSDEKQPENKVSRKVISNSKKSSERDQSSTPYTNSLRNKELSTENKIPKKKQSEKFEKIQMESKYSFVVDWQNPE
jgi:hypothetical protein